MFKVKYVNLKAKFTWMNFCLQQYGDGWLLNFISGRFKAWNRFPSTSNGPFMIKSFGCFVLSFFYVLSFHLAMHWLYLQMIPILFHPGSISDLWFSGVGNTMPSSVTGKSSANLWLCTIHVGVKLKPWRKTGLANPCMPKPRRHWCRSKSGFHAAQHGLRFSCRDWGGW